MSSDGLAQDQRDELEDAFGDRMRQDEPLARYTSARIGGPADYLLPVRSADELAEAAQVLWDHRVDFLVIGGGSNVLVSDRGVRGVVILNQARAVSFDRPEDGPAVWAESGASFGGLGRRAADRGLSGLEWASTVPGTVGGAVVNNAGAHGSDVAGCLRVAEILQHNEGPESWSPDELDYDYRESWLKKHPGRAVVLSATFELEASTPEETKRTMQEFADHRRLTQPTGASWGSMFKNPEDDYAGRLIEAAGLKGLQVGGAEVSEQHANFFVNRGGATAKDVWQLLHTVRRRVEQESGIELELEIQPVGDWEFSDHRGAGEGALDE